MKNIIALSIALLTAACGTVDNSSEASAARLPERVLFPVETQIEGVEVRKLAGKVQGYVTDVTVGLDVPCSNALEAFAVSYQSAQDSKIQILVSAFASGVKNPHGPFVCLAFSHETKTVTIPGVVLEQDLTLVHLNGQRAEVPASTIAIAPIKKIEILNAAPLCPENALCLTNGTEIEFEMTMSSCVNTIGSVAFKATRLDKGFSLAIHAIEFVDELSTRVDCAYTTKTYQMSLPLFYASQEEIQLQVLE